MAQRKSISKNLRFEVFKRDSFTCQYCGRMAPDVVLEVDHIEPVSEGGTNDLLNLVTSCFDCNRGKGSKRISNNSTVKIQQEELKKLSQKREQLEMVSAWRKELLEFKEEEFSAVNEHFVRLNGGKYTLSENSKPMIKNMISEYGLKELLICFEISFEKYYDFKSGDCSEVFKKLGGILYNRKQNEINPYFFYQQKTIHSLKGRFSYVDEHFLRLFVKKNIFSYDDYDSVMSFAKKFRHWDDFRKELEDNGF